MRASSMRKTSYSVYGLRQLGYKGGGGGICWDEFIGEAARCLCRLRDICSRLYHRYGHPRIHWKMALERGRGGSLFFREAGASFLADHRSDAFPFACASLKVYKN